MAPPSTGRRWPSLSIALAIVVLAELFAPPSVHGGQKHEGFRRQALPLPGMPAALFPADVDRDGRTDLAVFVAYTAWDTVSEFEQAAFGDIEGLVEVMTVVSALVDRRELRVYRGTESGFGEPLPALELSTSVHALGTGHPDLPLVAVTDEGLAAVHPVEDGSLELVPLVQSPTSLAGQGSFYSELEFLHDLDGDGIVGALLPTTGGWVVHRGVADGFAAEVGARIALPAFEDETREDEAPDPDGETDGASSDRPSRRHDLLPELADVDGDGLPDLVALRPRRGRGPVLWLNRGGLRFAEPVELTLAGSEEMEIGYVGDLDGDGRAEIVGRREIEVEDEAGFREEIDAAKRPTFDYRLHELASGAQVSRRPLEAFTAVGYTFEGSDNTNNEIELPGGFQDLDGDGRRDLVTITLDFSILPLLARWAFVRKLSLRMDFHPWCQLEDGSFVEVQGLDLSGKFKIDLRNTQIRHLSQFAGDFNGDGRADFVQLGRGRKITIHQGQSGCRYPLRPDRRVVLEDKPQHLGLVRILDLDGNGRSDLSVIHPLPAPKSGESIPVRLDLYLSEPH